MKTLIVYYSWRGKTELVATSISNVLDADLRKIEEVKKRKGLFGFISGGYGALKRKCSRIKPLNFSLSSYNLVFIGTPVWALRPTPAINTFISKANFKDKKVVLFVTMGGFGGNKTVKMLTDKIKLKGGIVIASFVVKTGGVKTEDIIKKGEEIGREFLIKKSNCSGLSFYPVE
ncbi:flavodoxin [Candidatus Aerophobetes bacterium]|nr:flavodoxin [Candidatus Aerophobetes bacterium]